MNAPRIFRAGGQFRIRLSVLAVCLAVGASSAAQDDANRTVRIVTEGCAPGVTPVSREAALRIAQEAAIRLWVESALGDSWGEEFTPMMSYLDTYTASSRLTNTRLDDGQTCIDAEFYLYERTLRADVAAIRMKSRSTPPSVAFLLIENNEADNARRFQERTAAAAPLIKTFRDKGFRVVEPAEARSVYGERELLAVVETGPVALARFAADLKAEVAVSLEIRLTTRELDSGLGTLRGRAQVNLLVVSASDAATLENTTAAAETTAADAATGLKFALDDALYKIRDRAVVGAVLAARGTAPDRFDLTIEGVLDPVAAERIAQALRKCHGITDTKVLTVRSGVARLQFRYSGRIGALVEYLESGNAGVAMRAVQVVNHDMVFRING